MSASQAPVMEETEVAEVSGTWTVLHHFPGQDTEQGDDIKYLNILPGDKLVSIKENEVKERNTTVHNKVY